MQTPADSGSFDGAGRILVVEDDSDLRDLIVAGLQAEGLEVEGTGSAESALPLVEQRWDVILVDVNLPGMSGLDLCHRVVAERDRVAVVMMTGFATIGTAVQAMRAGAYDFVVKPIDLEALSLRLQRIVTERRIRDEALRLRDTAEAQGPLGKLTGRSEPMLRVYELLRRSARSEASVLITGPSGTGKELASRALHDNSPRRDGPFVAVNCSAIPDALIESELFGHVRGAFTDARNDRAGLFVEAAGGTIFLDEIGELPLATQAKMLRALEERAVRPVGGDREIPFDTRVVAATNRDLPSAVEEGRFREDLFFRINVIHLELPPLSARGTDVLLLAQEFIRRFGKQERKVVRGLSHAAAQRLCDYPWPGNVRELRNCIERAVALTTLEEIGLEDLPDRVRLFKRSDVVVASSDPSELVPLEELERRYILRVLETVDGNRTAAARILGLDRKTLYRRLERYKKTED